MLGLHNMSAIAEVDLSLDLDVENFNGLFT